MRLRIALIFGLVAALALGAMSLSQAGSGDKVTGGGQTEVGATGAGDTIAFTAHATGDGDAATGQVQFVDRDGGTGQGQTVYHGTVTCLIVKGTVAEISGVWRDAGDFEIFVKDNGEGGETNDGIIVSPEAADPECGDNEYDEDDNTVLSRGNAQVHDAP